MKCEKLKASSILEELKGDLSKPCLKESEVLKSSLVAYARWMQTEKGYVQSEQTLGGLLKYMKGYGLFLMGGVGTGKTMFFRSLKSRIEIFSILRHMAKPLNEISEYIEGMRDSEMLIDDIGAEPVYINYGSKLDLLPWLLELRLESPKRTHFTTNLTAEQLERRYGNRVIDRIKELCKVCFFGGRSRRKAFAKGMSS